MYVHPSVSVDVHYARLKDRPTSCNTVSEQLNRKSPYIGTRFYNSKFPPATPTLIPERARNSVHGHSRQRSAAIGAGLGYTQWDRLS